MNRIQNRCAALLAGLTLATTAGQALAQAAPATDWPQRPVRVVVPYGPGSSPDILARLVNERLTARLGQAFIVENRPGAGGNSGTEYVAKATPDGQTFLLSVNAPLVYNTILYKNLRYDPFRELAPVTLAVTSPNVCAAANSMGVDSVKGWLDALRARPGQYNFASTGNGSISHLGVELLKIKTKSFAVHIPYASSSQAVTAMLQGDVHFACLPGATVMPQAKAGKLKVLAITSAERSPLLPEVPTLKESGVPDIQAAPWFAYMAPAGTPPAIVQRLNQALVATLREPEVAEKLRAQYFDVIASTPEELGRFMREEQARWRPVIQRAGLTPD
ncbi:MAG: tripartite tricarboxylate transporter substrate binding protein [Comamonadaceae bacterium]|jgi:tripartite-type tricarboxylate transporter receptor subunit TctC|uniref:Tripartite tricarboxylate transporter substrate binding protein n=1 Tax=Hydrogenophaga borbori TaxID=2294117 RepID=A0A372EHL4_9BURK|nr:MULTISPECIES: tripartite tricarboxylate transporter substrate binding protein [Hydrogenophaga]NCT97695.1 tripartite tricarboxylate transporter substrate binding protein [Comamonadaceae bacterium]RFP77915.1 tripartite tricarboxylate transporter substrate binding protein [Hydrogenophaga borbori]WQB83095.1 tripartite tricarboxylate transporter substrate binding protein [Hydrogenophaga sp. SNF1]